MREIVAAPIENLFRQSTSGASLEELGSGWERYGPPRDDLLGRRGPSGGDWERNKVTSEGRGVEHGGRWWAWVVSRLEYLILKPADV